MDDHIGILNFYVVKNEAAKDEETDDFKRYKKLRDGNKAFYLHEGCTRRWMNQSNEDRGSSGINIRWPVTSNEDFKTALKDAAEGKSPNNISPVITYSLEDGVKMAWFGDLETDFMEKIEKEIAWPDVDIVFAPHHGRDSGKIPASILEEMGPKIIVIGEAPSKNLNYYRNYNTITQNSAGSIYFECVENWVHIYVGSPTSCAPAHAAGGGPARHQHVRPDQVRRRPAHRRQTHVDGAGRAPGGRQMKRLVIVAGIAIAVGCNSAPEPEQPYIPATGPSAADWAESRLEEVQPLPELPDLGVELPDGYVSLEDYRNVKIGMSETDVEWLIGHRDGVTLSESATGKIVNYTNISGSFMTAVYEDRQLVIKSQVGLR